MLLISNFWLRRAFLKVEGLFEQETKKEEQKKFLDVIQ